MDNAAGRRFKLLDGMILVAATAAGLAALRTYSPYLLSGSRSRFVPPPWALPALVVARGAVWCAPMAAMWSLFATAISLRPPRPRLRRLAARPGLLACWAASLGLVLGLGMTFNFAVSLGVAGGPERFLVFCLMIAYPVGFIVAGAWAAAAWGGRWRPESRWLDRLGRALGLYWIALIPLSTIVLIFQ